MVLLERYHDFCDKWCYRFLEGKHQKCYRKGKESKSSKGLVRRASDPGFSRPHMTTRGVLPYAGNPKLLSNHTRSSITSLPTIPADVGAQLRSSRNVTIPKEPHRESRAASDARSEHTPSTSARSSRQQKPTQASFSNRQISQQLGSRAETVGQTRAKASDVGHRSSQLGKSVDFPPGTGQESQSRSQSQNHQSKASSHYSRQATQKSSLPEVQYQSPEPPQQMMGLDHSTRSQEVPSSHAWSSISRRAAPRSKSSQHSFQEPLSQQQPSIFSRGVSHQSSHRNGLSAPLSRGTSISQNFVSPTHESKQGSKKSSLLSQESKPTTRASGLSYRTSERSGSSSQTLKPQVPSRDRSSALDPADTAQMGTEAYNLGNADRTYIEGFYPELSTRATIGVPGADIAIAADHSRLGTEAYSLGNADRTYIEGFYPNESTRSTQEVRNAGAGRTDTSRTRTEFYNLGNADRTFIEGFYADESTTEAGVGLVDAAKNSDIGNVDRTWVEGLHYDGDGHVTSVGRSAGKSRSSKR